MTIPTLHLSPCLAAIALAAVLPMASFSASAQDSSNKVVRPAATTPVSQDDDPSTERYRALQREQRRHRKGAEEPASEVMYPLATRADPGIKPSRTGVKRLQKIAEAFQAGQDEATIAAALEVANDPDANAYEKAFSLEIAGNAASNKGDDAAAAEYFTKALASNGLGNNDFYTVMYNLAIVQYGLDQYGPALQNLERYLAETRIDKPEAEKLRGGILFGMERYADAAAQYTKLLAAQPGDTSLLMNAAAAYQQAGQPEKATALMKDAQVKGLLTDANGYRALYTTYINAEQAREALAVIDDGLAKGILKADGELARGFMVLGQKAFYDDDLKTAAAMYERAAPIAADGEASLNLAKIYAEQGKKAEARAAAQQALQKGVKDTAAAKRLAGGA